MAGWSAAWGTPNRKRSMTAAYAILTQTFAHRELDARALARFFGGLHQVIGSIMLILGMALGLTNFLIDAASPTPPSNGRKSVLPESLGFPDCAECLLADCRRADGNLRGDCRLGAVAAAGGAGLRRSTHGAFWRADLLANIEMGFLPPRASTSTLPRRCSTNPSAELAAAVVPAVLAMFLGALTISAIPWFGFGL